MLGGGGEERMNIEPPLLSVFISILSHCRPRVCWWGGSVTVVCGGQMSWGGWGLQQQACGRFLSRWRLDRCITAQLDKNISGSPVYENNLEVFRGVQIRFICQQEVTRMLFVGSYCVLLSVYFVCIVCLCKANKRTP